MPDKRNHRGPAPEDAALFAPGQLPGLRQAAQDLGWLLDRGYALRSALELVGNRYALTARQRLALGRCVCSEAARRRRRQTEVAPAALAGQELWLDGFNVLTALEAALAGGVVLLGGDGCCRDLASVYARHHEVAETAPALELLGAALQGWGVRRCRWWLDRPVSNSGRLQRRLLDLAARRDWDWTVDLVFNPDRVLAETEQIIATTDSVILDRCRRWFNLVRWVIAGHIPQAWVVDLGGGPAREIPGTNPGCGTAHRSGVHFTF
jgi:hypothetical protein